MLDKIVNNAKVALEIADTMKNQDLKSAILDLKEELLNLREENILLREKLSQRQEFNMVFENNRYFNVKEDNTRDGPFCTNCWDSHQVAIRLQHFNENTKHDCYICPKCENTTWI